MTRRVSLTAALAAAMLCMAMLPACGARPVTPGVGPASATDAGVTEVAHGLDHPWALAFLDDGSFLVTERVGRVRRIGKDGTVSAPIGGLPDVWAMGQAGLLDLELAPDFARSHRVYFSYVEPGDDDNSGTAAAMATLEGNTLHDVKVIYRETPKRSGTTNFGSRIAFDADGHVFISQGDRFQNLLAQGLDVPEGKLMRLALDGSAPPDNPFVGRRNALPMIWSYGHRNIEGLAVDPASGRLWASEHGPRGGDEINLPERGKNYGWPIASNGMDYSTNRPYPETVGTSAPGMVSPYHVWKKSPGLSGMAFLRGHPESAWNNSLFLGALADRNLIRLTLDGDRIVGEERLLDDLGARIRDVRVAKDGSVYVLTDDDNGRLLRLKPPAAH